MSYYSWTNLVSFSRFEMLEFIPICIYMIQFSYRTVSAYTLNKSINKV